MEDMSAMKRLASLIIVFAGLLIFTAAAHAETNYRFELYGAAAFPMHKDFEIGPPQVFGLIPGQEEFTTGVRGGIRFGVDGLERWGQDFTYSYGLNDAKILIDQSGEFAFTSRSHQFAYNALFYPGGLKRKLVPFVTAGVGGTIFTVSDKTVNQGYFAGFGKLEPHTSFAFNAGGGFRCQINDVFGLRFDVRDWMSHPPRYGIPTSSEFSDVMTLPVSGVFHQVETSVGFVIHFKTK